MNKSINIFFTSISKKNKVIICSLCLLVLLLAPWFYNPLTVTSYYLDFDKLPANFDGYKIAVIADLHNLGFGKNQKKLIELIFEQNPDIIVLAGDIIDKRSSDMTNVEDLLKGISDKFPIYAIPGNHDYYRSSRFDKLSGLYREYGVIFMDGDTVPVERDGQLVVLSSAELKHWVRGDIYSIDKSPTPVYKNEFNILLHHFGNEFDIISDDYDLVLSGHVHGGVIRLFSRGLFNTMRKKPFFPKYSKGVYRKESGSIMVLSAGLGDSIVPRFNNHREIVMVNLKVRI